MMTEETPDPLKRVTPYLLLSRDGQLACTKEMLSLISIRKDVCYHPSGAVNILTLSKSSKLGHVTNDTLALDYSSPGNPHMGCLFANRTVWWPQ